MRPTERPTSRLDITTAAVGGRPSTIILIDGVNILELQRPAVHPDGNACLSGSRRFIPPDPIDLLPPDSSALLPSASPKQAMIGVCECGEPGDASLWLQVRRQDTAVIWEPVNGQVVVPAGGHVKVPTLRVVQRCFVAGPPLVRASRMR
jgi:hypothetical protein